MPKTRTQYCQAWEYDPVLTDWIKRSSKGCYHVFCRFCFKDIQCDSGAKDLRRHAATKCHRTALEKARYESVVKVENQAEQLNNFPQEPEIIISTITMKSEEDDQDYSLHESVDNTEDSVKLWGGRFSTGLDPLMERFNESIHIDKRMWKADIEGSQAYAKALCKVRILSLEENSLIISGLQSIKEEWKSNTFKIKPGDEDIHTANERRLKELIGPEIGGKLHTGRSRNDQVATDMKLWLQEEINSIRNKFLNLLRSLTTRAKTEINIIMPGYTHMQRAQPVRWSHWLMSHAWSFYSDVQQLGNLKDRINFSPLGCGAIAGNPFNIDREALARDLGFGDCTQNSMQTVADRDFVAEFLFWASLTATHFSKMAEDLIMYSTKEFGFVSLSDAYSTGSSLMPQKRNPDSLELIRGKAGVMIGHCTGFLTVLKGLPSTYNKDLQNDKIAMFSAADDISNIIEITDGLITSLMVDPKRCIDALSSDMLATDVAYYLVRKGVPFRNAHEVAGKVVSLAELKQCQLHHLTLDDMKTISTKFEADIMDLWDYEHSVQQYTSIGGTSGASVLQQINKLVSYI